MKMHLCEYQESVLATGDVPVVISCCGNPKCSMRYHLVNQAVCEECPERQDPTTSRADILPDVPNLDLKHKRDAGEILQIMTKFCYKCKFYDKIQHTCGSCGCLAYESVEEKAIDATFHCPLGVW
jgi:hypothetical protein